MKASNAIFALFTISPVLAQVPGTYGNPEQAPNPSSPAVYSPPAAISPATPVVPSSRSAPPVYPGEPSMSSVTTGTATKPHMESGKPTHTRTHSVHHSVDQPPAYAQPPLYDTAAPDNPGHTVHHVTHTSNKPGQYNTGSLYHPRQSNGAGKNTHYPASPSMTPLPSVTHPHSPPPAGYPGPVSGVPAPVASSRAMPAQVSQISDGQVQAPAPTPSIPLEGQPPHMNPNPGNSPPQPPAYNTVGNPAPVAPTAHTNSQHHGEHSLTRPSASATHAVGPHAQTMPSSWHSGHHATMGTSTHKPSVPHSSAPAAAGPPHRATGTAHTAPKPPQPSAAAASAAAAGGPGAGTSEAVKAMIQLLHGVAKGANSIATDLATKKPAQVEQDIHAALKNFTTDIVALFKAVEQCGKGAAAHAKREPGDAFVPLRLVDTDGPNSWVPVVALATSNAQPTADSAYAQAAKYRVEQHQPKKSCV